MNAVEEEAQEGLRKGNLLSNIWEDRLLNFRFLKRLGIQGDCIFPEANSYSVPGMFLGLSSYIPLALSLCVQADLQ